MRFVKLGRAVAYAGASSALAAGVLACAAEHAGPEEVLDEDAEWTESATAVPLPAAIAPRSLAEAVSLLDTAYGAGEGELGGTGEPDAMGGDAGDPGDLVGPQSLAVTEDGRVLVLDGVNGRLVRLEPDGSWAGVTPIDGTPVQGDLGVDLFETVSVLVTSPEPRLDRFRGDVRYESSLLPESPEAFPMGLIVAPEGEMYLDLSSGDVVAASAFSAWQEADEGASLPGIPVGAGVFAYPSLLDEHRAAVRFFNADEELLREYAFTSVPALAEISRISVDDLGRLFVVFDRFEDGSGGTHAEHLVVAVTAEGEPAGSVAIPASRDRSLWRPVAISPTGGVYQLLLDRDRARVLRWELEPAGGAP